MNKRIVSLLLTLTMLLGLLPAGAAASAAPAGDQQPEVVEIATAGQLKAALSNMMDDPYMSAQEGKELVLTADIELPRSMFWFAVGLNTVLDGQGHVITLNDQQLFDQITANGQVRNLGLKGTASGASYKGPLAVKSAGKVTNCWSHVSVKDTENKTTLKMGGLIGTLQEGGLVENCYTAASLTGKGPMGGLVGYAEFGSTVKNSYWLENSPRNAVGAGEGTVENCAPRSEADMKTAPFLDLLNANRGAGLQWTSSDSGYPHLGEASDSFRPAEAVDVTLSLYGGEPVTFSSADGLTLDPWDLPADVRCGELSTPGATGWSIDYGRYGKNIMVAAGTGELFVYGPGSAVVEVGLEGKSSASFTLTVTQSGDVYDVRLTNGEQEIRDGAVTVAGRSSVRLIPQIQQVENGPWITVNPMNFTFSVDRDMIAMVSNNLVTMMKPGTVTVTARGLGRTLSVDVTSTYVPIEKIEPSPSGEYIIHERHTMVFDGRPADFLDLNLSHQAGSVIIQPDNASRQDQDAFTVSFSDPSVADYVPEFVLGVRPLKAGTTDITVTTVGQTPRVSGSSTVTLKYRNPLTELKLAQTSFTLAEGQRLALPLTFVGEVSDQGYHVTEPGMTWSFRGSGSVAVTRPPEAIAVNSARETAVANDAYFLDGLSAGTVTVTGTPWDTVNGVEPITFTVTVTPGSSSGRTDYEQLARDDSRDAARWLSENPESDYLYGFEWEVFSLTRGGYPLSQAQVGDYLDSVERQYSGPTEAIDRKPTTLARVILTLGVLGQDASDFRGLDFISMLLNSQGMEVGSNESAWALIALDTLNYPVPDGARWSRQSLIRQLLTFQGENGGFGLFGPSAANADTTAMAIQGLASCYHRGDQAVDSAVDSALDYLRSIQDPTGGYGTVESTAQVLVALTSLGLDPMDPANGFLAGSRSLLSNLHGFRDEVSGGFRHTMGGSVTSMSTIQAFYSLESYLRLLDGSARLYDLTDVRRLSPRQQLMTRLERAQALNPADYTSDSWAAVAAAADGAKAVLADPASGPEDFVRADNQLAQAVSALKKAGVPVPTPSDTITVTIRLMGAALSPEPVDMEKGTGLTEYQEWIPTTSYTLPRGSLVYDLFVKAVEDAGLKQTGAGSNYVSSITAPQSLGGYQLSEMTNGPFSGWMYTIDGVHPDLGLREQVLSDGDTVVWHYVNDYRYESGYDPGAPSAPTPIDRLETVQNPDGSTTVLVEKPSAGLVPVIIRKDGTEEVIRKTAAAERGLTFFMPRGAEIMLADRSRAFVDVAAADWFRPYVDFVVSRQLFAGISDTQFGPGVPMTRGMLVMVLNNLENNPMAGSAAPFADVGRDEWYASAVAWAAEKGIVSGYGDGSFGPGDRITREQLAVMLWNYAGKPEASAAVLPFADSAEVSSYARSAVLWAVEAGVMRGTDGNRLAPTGSATRAEAAAMLCNFMNRL